VKDGLFVSWLAGISLGITEDASLVRKAHIYI